MAQNIEGTIINRNDTEENWLASTRILAKGEFGIGYKADGSAILKLGDGTSLWKDLKAIPLVDTALSTTSENAVQNKVIAQKFGDIDPILDDIIGIKDANEVAY